MELLTNLAAFKELSQTIFGTVIPLVAIVVALFGLIVARTKART